MLLNRIRPEIYPILRKNQNGFRKNRSTTGQILTIRRILEGVKDKNRPLTLLFIDFSKAFDTINREMMKIVLIKYGLPSETVNAIMILYKNTRSMVRSPDGDTPFFEITTGLLQGDTLAPFLFIICLDYILKNSLDCNKDLGFTISKRKSSRYPAVSIPKYHRCRLRGRYRSMNKLPIRSKYSITFNRRQSKRNWSKNKFRKDGIHEF